ncbi:putative transcription factor interactor and regulator CCHC(Zn) family [Rosa chinensis]|uniref:Putative transcription factor interactor and regulator CCHC(Zn) family n=1 Tax=Rosa chinensis TaxID=74649 RepID=A0A2P6SH78_ROSCH|nr:uncharacterized protein LOC112181538 [Rosa chinensis]XP_040372317.1 uncharacterized protein LOC112181538 [Rosa chinensis]PRQ58042.1 putative transcription factor interactor and regulator CCHC(Zn) family [Rosa chinensis]
MALNIIKLSMSKTVKGSIPKKELAKEYLEAVALKFKENEKAEASQLMHIFDTMRYNGTGNVREYIMKMIDIATKLNDLEMPLKDDYVIQHALNTLPNMFSQLKTSHFSQKDKWSLDEFIAICTQDENRIRREKELTVNLVDKPEWKHANKLKPNKTNGAAVVKPDQKLKPFQFMCYFCKKNGYMKRDCNSYKNWVSKRGVHKEEGTEEK